MIPWTLLDASHIPGDGGELRLYRRGNEFSIRVGSYELMNSRVHGSEDALATLVCARLGDAPRARILIGGLGMGFTLTALLGRASKASAILVAELVPAVVAWHRGPLAAISNGALDDPRVTVLERDVADVIRHERNALDAILLDVDNGPSALTSQRNARLYEAAGLRSAFAALRVGGILAVWSADNDDRFTLKLRKTGFETDVVPVRARGTKGPRHVIWIARKILDSNECSPP